jgi:hypothetical protein
VTEIGVTYNITDPIHGTIATGGKDETFITECGRANRGLEISESHPQAMSFNPSPENQRDASPRRNASTNLVN